MNHNDVNQLTDCPKLLKGAFPKSNDSSFTRRSLGDNKWRDLGSGGSQ